MIMKILIMIIMGILAMNIMNRLIKIMRINNDNGNDNNDGGKKNIYIKKITKHIDIYKYSIIIKNIKEKYITIKN